jgi:hypothetical protein
MPTSTSVAGIEVQVAADDEQVGRGGWGLFSGGAHAFRHDSTYAIVSSWRGIESSSIRT